MNISSGIIQATLLGGLVALSQVPTQGGGATPPTDAQVRDLEQQIESLQQQLDRMNAHPYPGDREPDDARLGMDVERRIDDVGYGSRRHDANRFSAR